MNITNNTQNSICSTCGASIVENTPNMERGISPPQSKQDYWKIVEFFYPSYNPFANEFSAGDITKPVQDILMQMSRDFATCCEKTTPFEYIDYIYQLVAAITSLNVAGVYDAMTNIMNINKPGARSYEACRNSIAASTKSRLYLAFLGI